MSVAERPILFNGPMVCGILQGRKTQTRRVVKDPFDTKGGQFCVEYADTDPNILVHIHNPKCGGFCDYTCCYPCPYGKIGDRLWVRETWAVDAQFDALPPRALPVRGMPVYFRCTTQCMDYMWRPSIHMPRWASRITLEITDVRVHRLQNICEQDAVDEGIIKYPHQWESMDYPYAPWAYQAFERSAYRHTCATEAFKELWDSLNAKRGHGWSTNPWVWAVSFKVVQPCQSL